MNKGPGTYCLKPTVEQHSNPGFLNGLSYSAGRSAIFAIGFLVH